MSIESSITRKISLLPEAALTELAQYLDYLTFKHQPTKDWAEQLTDDQKESIRHGLDDWENGRVVPHSEVAKKMKDYLNQQSK